MSSPRTALVLGGGLAGIAAAVRLAESGVAVTLLETSRRLGGRATSHDDPATGETLDNCQHVLLGCCTNLLDLYQRLGVADRIDWHPDLHFFDKAGHHGTLAADDFPAPIHLTRSLWSLSTLNLREKLAISRAMFAMMRLPRSARDQLHDRTFEQWLLDHGQPRRAIDRFWAVIIVSALNQWPDRAAADAAIQVFQEGFLAHPDAYVMGTAAVPLRDLYDPAVRTIEAAGGQVRFGASVEAIEHDGSSISGVRLAGSAGADGERLEADLYLSALPFDRLNRVIPDELREGDPRLQRLDRFTHSPILGIHLWFDRPVTDHPHLILVDSPLQWVFNKTAASDATGADVGWGERSEPHQQRGDTGGMACSQAMSEESEVAGGQAAGGQAAGGQLAGKDAGQYLHGVISAAHEWAAERPDRIVEMAVEELAAYCPAVRDARLIRGRAIKEKRATFSITPGIGGCRPGPTPNGRAGDVGWVEQSETHQQSGGQQSGGAGGTQRPEAQRRALCESANNPTGGMACSQAMFEESEAAGGQKVTGQVAGLFLAGDWTDTGWPATMEGAVRSGYRAAAAALNEPDQPTPVDDLPASALYRLVENVGRALHRR